MSEKISELQRIQQKYGIAHKEQWRTPVKMTELKTERKNNKSVEIFSLSATPLRKK